MGWPQCPTDLPSRILEPVAPRPNPPPMTGADGFMIRQVQDSRTPGTRLCNINWVSGSSNGQHRLIYCELKRGKPIGHFAPKHAQCRKGRNLKRHGSNLNFVHVNIHLRVGDTNTGFVQTVFHRVFGLFHYRHVVLRLGPNAHLPVDRTCAQFR